MLIKRNQRDFTQLLLAYGVICIIGNLVLVKIVYEVVNK